MKPQKLQTEWNLSMLYSSDTDPKMKEDRKIIQEQCDLFVNKWKTRIDYLENVAILREALDDYEQWVRKYEGGGAEWYYFYLRSDQDQSDPKIRAKMTQIQNFKQKIDNETRFFYLNLSKISEKNQQVFLEATELQMYKHFLERIFAEAKHLLSEAEEKIISMKSTPAFGNWVKMTSTFISKEEREILLEDGTRALKSFSDILSLVDSPIKEVRDEAAAAFNEILEKYADIATEEINSILENKKIDDELRGIEKPEHARHLHDDIDSETVNTVVDTVSTHNNVAARFYQLKAKLLGQDKLAYHERNVPYGDVNKNYSYEEAIELLMKVFKNLDSTFAEILKQFIENGHIDVYPKKGKRGGAFCAYHLISYPTYVMLNYADKLDDVLTIAHEMGHGINDELIKLKQHALHFGTPLSTAEVASTFMEDFVLDEVVKEANDELKLSIMMMKLNSDISSVFRQVACYQFEQKLHEQYRETGYLSREDIGKLFQETMKGYMGEYVEQSPGSENWWVYWGHIRYFFYVYSYASGLLISKSLQRLVKKDKEQIEKVKEFLSAGLSDSPRNIFLRVGIDIADKKFWDNGIKEIEQLLDETTALAKRLGKI